MVPRRNPDACPVPITPARVAGLFGVSEQTVRRWEKAGKLSRCGNGPLRFRDHEIRALLAGSRP